MKVICSALNQSLSDISFDGLTIYVAMQIIPQW